MKNGAMKQSGCGQMDFAQTQFLKSKGFAHDKSIVDCSIKDQTVTFDDGTVRTVCERWSRTMGYYRPLESWNPGKQQEHRDRRYFREAPLEALALTED